MKAISGFIAGVLFTAAIGAAAQCTNDGDLVPLVQIRDMWSGQLLMKCSVAMTLLGGQEIRCDRRPARK